MQDVQEHSSVSKLNNGAIHCKSQSTRLAGKGLFEMLNETYFSQLKKMNLQAASDPKQRLFYFKISEISLKQHLSIF